MSEFGWIMKRKIVGEFRGEVKKMKNKSQVLYYGLLALETEAYLFAGGAVTCASLHIGEIRPGEIRGNHRHHDCNETFVIWGATTKFRVSSCFVPDSHNWFLFIDAWHAN